MLLSHSRTLPEPTRIAQQRAEVAALLRQGATNLLSTAARSTARESQLVNRLPRPEVETYSRLYRQEEDAHLRYLKVLCDNDRAAAVGIRFAGRQTPNKIDASRMTDQQLGEYCELLSASYVSRRQFKVWAKNSTVPIPRS